MLSVSSHLFRKPVLFADTITVVAFTGGVSAHTINRLCFCCLFSFIIALPVGSALFASAEPFPNMFT